MICLRYSLLIILKFKKDLIGCALSRDSAEVDLLSKITEI